MQPGSVLGVALFGSLVGQSRAFMTGSLIISAGVLLAAAAAIWWRSSIDTVGHEEMAGHEES
jgi:DHA2 family methylenomycin A resistance protein-like MFS transporter